MSYSRPQISVVGGFTPEFMGTSFISPKGTSLRGTTRFEPSLVQIGRTVRPVALAKKTKKKKKNKKQELSQRKQIVRQLRTQLVEGISVTLKSRLRVTQGH